MSRDCRAFIEQLSCRLDGALESAPSVRLEEHLAGCASCRARELSLLAQGEAVRAQAAGLLAEHEARGEIDLSGFSARVLRATEREAHRPSFVQRLAVSLRERWEHQRLAISAGFGLSLAGCAGLLLLATMTTQRTPSSGSQLLAAQQPLGTQASIDTLELLSGANGAVFEQPGETTVIWVTEETAE